VNIFGAKQNNAPLPGLYATSTDFCRIFEQDMDRLYLLSLMLTGDHELAEKCFVAGLETSKSGNPVFKEWAQSWARRSIVQNAIRAVHPRPTDVLSSRTELDRTKPAALAAILLLPTFDRFAYVLSVLEGYPLQECALLLNCRRDQVNTARMRALQEVVNSVERGDAIKSINPESQLLQDRGRFHRVLPLAATA